jgi:carbamoyltransferase
MHDVPLGSDGPVLGVNCFSHDTAAALVVDGQLVALGEEERFARDQHTKLFPDQAVRFCLDRAGLEIEDLAAVAVAQDPIVDYRRGAADALRRAAPKRLAAQTYTDAALIAKELSFRRRWRWTGPVVRVGHHVAHAASAYYASPFDDAAVLTVDRGGDFLSTTLVAAEGDNLRTLAEVRNPQSLGELYTALTTFLGFRANADEGKVMGLAPYGGQALTRDFAELVRLDSDGLFHVDLRWFGWHRQKAPVSDRFERRYGPARVAESEITDRDKDLAYAVQDTLEHAGVHIARRLRDLAPSAHLCLSGGVALNSAMNMRILTEAAFDDVFVQPAASDAGNALGAALWVWHQLMGHPRTWRMDHAYWGTSWSDAQMRQALDASDLPVQEADDRARAAAHLLADGKVVGWFQGDAEVGPRALGARSILADPRRAEMRDIVNDRVKHREWFRPFAPSVLHEHAADYFTDYRYNPFMLLVQQLRPDMRDRVPAITHVDGTGRLQSVTSEHSPLFHQLITAFFHLTGVPMVLNTSFNVRGEPIVHRPQEAVHDFLTTDMDALIMGPYVVEKKAGHDSNRPA